MSTPNTTPIEKRLQNLFEEEYGLLLKHDTQIKRLTIQKKRAWAYRLSLITLDMIKTWEQDGKP